MCTTTEPHIARDTFVPLRRLLYSHNNHTINHFNDTFTFILIFIITLLVLLFIYLCTPHKKYAPAKETGLQKRQGGGFAG